MARKGHSNRKKNNGKYFAPFLRKTKSLYMMADEAAINLKTSLSSSNEIEQNGSRNDVLVKIGLVGDAQVFKSFPDNN